MTWFLFCWKEFDGSFLNCIRKAGGDAEQLLRIVYERFKPFQDHSQYKGKTGRFCIVRFEIVFLNRT